MNNPIELVRSNFTEIVKDLHHIVDFEYTSIELASPSKLKITELLININSFCLLTKEIGDVLIENYHSDKDFRRLWGSISTQFSLLLEMKYGIKTEDFASSIISFINLDNNKNIEIGSFTEASILEARISTDGYSNATLLSINDFWIICFFLTRLTLQESTVVKETLEKIHKESNLAAEEIRAIKQRLEKKEKREAVKITNSSGTTK